MSTPPREETRERALSLLLREPSARSLADVTEMVTECFRHADGLAERPGLLRGDRGGAAPSRDDYVGDRERILAMLAAARADLARKSEPNHSFLAMTCPDIKLAEPHSSFLKMTCADVSSGGEAAPPSVDASAAEDIVREFRLHARRFDALYRGRAIGSGAQ